MKSNNILHNEFAVHQICFLKELFVTKFNSSDRKKSNQKNYNFNFGKIRMLVQANECYFFPSHFSVSEVMNSLSFSLSISVNMNIIQMIKILFVKMLIIE